jgi:DNA modification methylase/ribosomal protein S27E
VTSTRGFAAPNASPSSAFRSRGIRRQPSLFDDPIANIDLAEFPMSSILSRQRRGRFFGRAGERELAEILARHADAAPIASTPPTGGMSAGKNTYTYDAHTYHTKVPPQGIAELLLHYLPAGGLVLDPFAGSGMTGVAARAHGHDCILNELSPAACFIANRFTVHVDVGRFDAGVEAILDELRELRRYLYMTRCRECDKETEILYTVWSYRVICNHCETNFLLWDHCRKYGKRVREHKILTEFPCPSCGSVLKKSRLRRTIAEPVMIGYKCCTAGPQETMHPLTEADLKLIRALEEAPPLAKGFYPKVRLPDGVNLRQPLNHGLDRIDKLYTPRNLAALSHIWRTVHRVEDADVVAHLAFVFTSLYQRVTRLSEFRFWGGSGNTARFNVPYIFNEANVFLTFERKARTIRDHLQSTAAQYGGKAVVVQNSATSLDYITDASVDLIFTDPPFGANINYSEMNFLWEAWLGEFTNNRDEAIINKVQGKTVDDYRRLMTFSMKECFRVLRPGHWMLLVFMNTSREVWQALRQSVSDAGFSIEKIDSFDKQHGTFKQFVSENAAGFDLVLHCRKPEQGRYVSPRAGAPALRESVIAFLSQREGPMPTILYLHVGREEEVDYRKLYSEWMARSLLDSDAAMNFSEFRSIVLDWLRQRDDRTSPRV